MAKTYNELINGLSPLEDAIKATKDQKEFDGYKEKFEKLKNDFNDAKDSLGPQKETVQSYIDDVQSAIDSWSSRPSLQCEAPTCCCASICFGDKMTGEWGGFTMVG